MVRTSADLLQSGAIRIARYQHHENGKMKNQEPQAHYDVAPQYRRSRGRLLKGTLLLVVGAVAALAAVAALSALGLLPFQARTIDRSQPTLLQSIQQVSRLESAVGNFEKVIDIEEGTTGVPSLLAGRRTLFVAAGTVDAYVDLSSVSEGDLETSPDGKAVTLHLPEAQLDKPNLNFDRSYTYRQDRGLFDVVADSFTAPDQAKLYKLAETKFAEAAAESDLRGKATEQTKTFLSSLGARLGVKVSFRE